MFGPLIVYKCKILSRTLSNTQIKTTTFVFSPAILKVFYQRKCIYTQIKMVCLLSIISFCFRGFGANLADREN